MTQPPPWNRTTVGTAPSGDGQVLDGADAYDVLGLSSPDRELPERRTRLLGRALVHGRDRCEKLEQRGDVRVDGHVLSFERTL